MLGAHGGGQHKRARDVVARAARCVAAGFAVVTLDAPGHGERPRSEESDRLGAEMRAAMRSGRDFSRLSAEFSTLMSEQAVPEWRSVLDALAEESDLAGIVEHAGFWGVSMGSAIGIPLVAAESRIQAAVLGLIGANDVVVRAAEEVTVPVRFLLQWDDRVVARENGMAMFDAFAATDKSLHANPGDHGEVPRSEVDESVRFLSAALGASAKSVQDGAEIVRPHDRART